MTEAEWWACTDAGAMLAHLRRVVGKRRMRRRLRLFAAACARRSWHLVTDERCRAAVAVAERYADRAATSAELAAAWALACAPANAAFEGGSTLQYDALRRAAYVACPSAPDAAWTALLIGPARDAEPELLLRDLFGNPFVPVGINPTWLEWRDGTVVRLARAVYDERAFDRLPVLADALEESGCDSRALLDHCRGRGPHVLGCWAVDLLCGHRE